MTTPRAASLKLLPATAKKPPRARRKAITVPKLRATERRTIGQFIAAIAAAFLPVASYVLSHIETKTSPLMWALVLSALTFSAPTLAEWAQRWCKSNVKAWGFTVLLEGVMVFSETTYLGYAGLAILVVINCYAAWYMAGKE